MHFRQRWALPQIRKLRTQVSICGFADLISYRKYLRICGEKLKFTTNPQSNRQSCLFRGKTAWKKWSLLFSGLDVNVRELMTFFFLEINVWSMAKFDLQNQKKSSRRQNNSKYCGPSLQKCNVHLRLRKCEKLPQTYRKLVDLRLRNTSCSFAEFAVAEYAVAELGANLRCPGLIFGCSDLDLP